MDQLIETIDSYVKKVPALPDNIKEIIVKFSPWLAIVTIVFSAPALLSVLGINSYVNSIGLRSYMYSTLGADYMFRYRVTQGVMLVNLVLVGISIPGLFSRSKSGWMFMFYSTLVYAVHSVISRNIVGGIVGLAISLYVLFQVKSYYIKDKSEGKAESVVEEKSASEEEPKEE